MKRIYFLYSLSLAAAVLWVSAGPCLAQVTVAYSYADARAKAIAEGKLIFNPTYEERAKCDLDLIVAGTEKKVIMLEAGANRIGVSAGEALLAEWDARFAI